MPAIDLGRLPDLRSLLLERDAVGPAELLSDRLPRRGPEDWDEGAGLREVVLASFPLASARALRFLVGELFTLYLECTPPRSPEATPRLQLAAVESDLRHSARALALVAGETLKVVETRGRDRRCGRLADRLAVDVEKLADCIALHLRPRQTRGRSSRSEPGSPQPGGKFQRPDPGDKL